MTFMNFEPATNRRTLGGRAGQLAPWLVAACVVVSIYGGSPNFRWQPGPDATPYAGDFVQDWLGAYMVKHGSRDRFYEIAYAQQLQHDTEVLGYDWDEDKYYPLVYPPYYYRLVSPLAWLPYQQAAWVWGLGMTICLCGVVALFYFHARRVWLGAGQRSGYSTWLRWIMPASLLFMPVIESLSSNQKGTVCLLILTTTFALLRAEKPFAAGVTFGLLAFKPQLALVIGLAMLWKRQWRFVVGSATTLAALFCLSLSLGTGVCLDYFRFSIGAGDYIQTAGYDLTHSHCLYGFFTLLFVDQELWIAQFATVLFGCVIAGLLIRLLYGPVRTSSRRFEKQYAGLVVATVLISPHLFTYDLAILLIPIFLIGGEWLIYRPAGHTELMGFSLATYVVPQFSMLVAAHTGVQLSVLLLAGLLVALTRIIRTDGWVAATPPQPCSVVS